MTSFIPYLALPVGANTSIPVCSLIAMRFLPRAAARPPIAVLTALLVGAPLLVTLLQQILGSEGALLRAAIAWGFYVLPLAAVAVIVSEDRGTLIAPLKFCISSTFALCILQMIAIRSGSIPFISYYNVPGYASVEDQQFEIVNYIQRPFAQFPEPSFMAGTVALSLGVLLVLMSVERRPLGLGDWLVVGLGCATILVSSSGSGLFTLGALAVLALKRARQAHLRPILIMAGLVFAVYSSAAVLSSRATVTGNYSWRDRSASLTAPFEYVAGRPIDLVVGLGKGGLNHAFAAGDIDLSEYATINRIDDAASVLVRLIIEAGVLGAALCLLLMVVQVLGFSVASKLDAVVLPVLWLVVAGLTIGYDSAVWIWMAPGVGLGLSEARRRVVGLGAEHGFATRRSSRAS